MNVRTLVRPIVAALMLAAAMPVFAVDADALVFNCSDMRLPNQQTVSRVFGIGNFGQAYAARDRAVHIAQRACLSGAGRVQIAVSDASNPATPVYAKSAE